MDIDLVILNIRFKTKNQSRVEKLIGEKVLHLKFVCKLQLEQTAMKVKNKFILNT